MGKVNTIKKVESNGATYEILEYESLQGVTDPAISEELYFAQKSGARLRQVKITLHEEDSEVVTEAGKLHYFRGNIEQVNKVGGVKGFANRFIQSKAGGEEIFRPSYRGKGVVYLEPTFDHLTLISMEDDKLVLDRDLFYCSSDSIDVGMRSIKSISSAVLGSDGWFQTTVQGSGVLVVSLPVPKDELRVEALKDEKLQVDGDFTLIYDDNLDFTVEKSNKRWFRTALSGEGFLETFTGTGRVYLAPTLDQYEYLEEKHYKNTKGGDGDEV